MSFAIQSDENNSKLAFLGPDGKEIILRRYLNDQSPDSNPFLERGFLNLAMHHLNNQQKQQLQGASPYQHPQGRLTNLEG